MIYIFTLYTDGSCQGPIGHRTAGYGAIIINESRNIYREIYGKIDTDKSTNQVAELTAAIYGISTIVSNFPYSEYQDESIEVYTDSAYIVNCFKDRWYVNWFDNNWVNSKGKPVENKLLWQQLFELTKQYPITFKKVKGHLNNALNNRCDKLAKLGATSIGDKYVEV